MSSTAATHTTTRPRGRGRRSTLSELCPLSTLSELCPLSTLSELTIPTHHLTQFLDLNLVFNREPQFV